MPEPMAVRVKIIPVLDIENSQSVLQEILQDGLKYYLAQDRNAAVV